MEQLFSKVKRTSIEHASASDNSDWRLAAAMGSLKGTKAQEDDLISEAQRIYVSLLRSQKSRCHVVARLDKGTRAASAKQKAKTTEAAWHRRRRQAAKEAALRCAGGL